jgi:hypothetical protein
VAGALAGPVTWRTLRGLRPEPVLVVPALAAFALYALVAVETRYVAPSVMLLCAGLVPPWAIDELSRRIRLGLATGAVATLLLGVQQVRADASFWRGASAARSRAIATLEAKGIGPGARVAFIGDAYVAVWAHEAGVRFVALLPRAEAPRFWALNAGARARVLARMRGGGAVAIIAEAPGPGFSTEGWEWLPHPGAPEPPLMVYADLR